MSARAGGGTAAGTGGGLLPQGLRFLRRRPRVLLRLAGWSALEGGQTFLFGYALARALDDGFLARQPATGLAWLAAAAVAAIAGAYGTGRAFHAVAGLVEPLRDALVRRVVGRALGTADPGAVSRLTHQVEIARDTFAGVVTVARSFVFTAAGALVGLASLAPVLLLVVVPPLAAGLGLFLATLRPLARRQEAFLAADERVAAELGALVDGLRDVTAAGAEAWAERDAAAGIAAETRAAESAARWGTLRVLALAVAGWLPLILLLLTAPWLLGHGATPGALAAAIAYVTQSLLPALTALMQGFGAAGSRLAVVLRRLTAGTAPSPAANANAGAEAGPSPVANAGTVGAARPARPSPAADADADGTAAGPPPHGAERRLRQPLTSPAPSADRRAARAGAHPGASDHAPAPAHRGGPAPAIRLQRVTFAYGAAAEPVLRDFSLDVPTGGRLAIVGPSGIGKSTLAALIAGTLTPDRGTVLLAGQAVPGTARTTAPTPAPDPARLARRRVLVPQEAYVFTATLRDNLSYHHPTPPPDPELLASCTAVGAADLVARLGGLDAVLRPGPLSAGERQLIALARAHAAPAPLLLLDEAACHLDPAAEERAERAFAAQRHRTLVIVTHRLASARRAEQVLVMDGRGQPRLDSQPLTLDSQPPTPDSQPPRALRDPDGVHPVPGPGLTGDGGHVIAHRARRQVQLPGDLGHREPFGRE